MQNLKYGYLPSSFGGIVVSRGQLPVPVPCQGATKRSPQHQPGRLRIELLKIRSGAAKDSALSPFSLQSLDHIEKFDTCSWGICLVDGDPLPQRCVMILGVKLMAVTPLQQRRAKEANMSILLLPTGQQQGTKWFAGCLTDENREVQRSLWGLRTLPSQNLESCRIRGTVNSINRAGMPSVKSGASSEADVQRFYCPLFWAISQF
jgi:hypothetical protein